MDWSCVYWNFVTNTSRNSLGLRCSTDPNQTVENLDSWFPRMTCRSTPCSEMTASLTTPPLEPSLSMARVSAAERERHTRTQRETHRERERHTERERERHTERERDTHRERERETHRERERHTQRERETHTEREREREIIIVISV